MCPQAPDGGDHHWVQKRDGQWAGQPAYRLVCSYCGTEYNPTHE